MALLNRPPRPNCCLQQATSHVPCHAFIFFFVPPPRFFDKPRSWGWSIGWSVAFYLRQYLHPSPIPVTSHPVTRIVRRERTRPNVKFIFTHYFISFIFFIHTFYKSMQNFGPPAGYIAACSNYQFSRHTVYMMATSVFWHFVVYLSMV